MENKPTEAQIKAKTEEVFTLGKDKLFNMCPSCGEEMEHRWQQGLYYDDSSPVRWCHRCDKAYIWRHSYSGHCGR